ncbi:unnamed protein product [Echinostoma caproni]|uniref:Uncharacterized protein n=1 Tax=Echinostoma caproni TaxID=27848 RepID=A0A183AV28_9TREM|nr:unnamed protein product [Echinostoma caproni]
MTVKVISTEEGGMAWKVEEATTTAVTPPFPKKRGNASGIMLEGPPEMSSRSTRHAQEDRETLWYTNPCRLRDK